MVHTNMGLIPEFYVRDISASRAFYVGVLGFDVLFERPEEGFVYLAREGAELMLDAVDQGRTWLAAELEVPFGRGVNVQIWTADVDTLYKQVEQSGARIFLALEEVWYRTGVTYGGNRQFVVQDPDGYLLRFAQDLGTRNAVPSS
tara:strand:- start:330 stop:764 length:435 start_codon:yes stop_codon:yes gene_type:complete